MELGFRLGLGVRVDARARARAGVGVRVRVRVRGRVTSMAQRRANVSILTWYSTLVYFRHTYLHGAGQR